MANELQLLESRKQELIARGEVAQLEYELPILESWATGLESMSRLADPDRFREEVGRWIGTDPNSEPGSGYLGRRVTNIDMVGDRLLGQDRLLFSTESDLAKIRGFARVLTNEVAPAISVQRNLTNYVIGTNWKYSIEPVEDSGSDQLAEEWNHWLQHWLTVNKWVGLRDREAYRRAKRDGETLIKLLPIEDGMSRVRFIEPSLITEPINVRELEDWLHTQFEIDHVALSWTFGVVTPHDDFETVIGWHLVADPNGANWKFLPESHGIHLKAVVDCNVKRGVSEFHPVYNLIRYGEKLIERVAQGGIVQASIVAVKEAPAGTKESQITGINRIASRAQVVEGGTRQIDQSRFDAPTMMIMSPGFKYVPGPMGSQRNPTLLMAGQGALRLAGTRWNMPEWMISGDASNNNFASSLVAESPFVKSAEAEQHAFAEFARELIWKAIRIAMTSGQVDRLSSLDQFESLKESILITIVPTPVQSRDPLIQAQRSRILVDAGIMSRQTAAEEAGLDWETEQQRMLDGIDQAMERSKAAGLEPVDDDDDDDE